MKIGKSIFRSRVRVGLVRPAMGAEARADAEDVVQEAFVRFWRRNLSIKNRALLYAAVRSRCPRSHSSGITEELDATWKFLVRAERSGAAAI